MEVPVSEMRLVDWRGRPAVVCGSRVGAVRASSAEELADRYFEILRGAGGFDALGRVVADQASEC
jgi:hypothetical protein